MNAARVNDRNCTSKILTLNQSISSICMGSRGSSRLTKSEKGQATLLLALASSSRPTPAQTFRQRSYTVQYFEVAHLNFTVDYAQDQDGTIFRLLNRLSMRNPLPQTLDLVEAQVLCDRMRGCSKRARRPRCERPSSALSTPLRAGVIATDTLPTPRGYQSCSSSFRSMFSRGLTDLGLQSQFSKWMIEWPNEY